MLEENIESTKQGRVYPSEVEVELRKRLTQLTDHLIQKQTQVLLNLFDIVSSLYFYFTLLFISR